MSSEDEDIDLIDQFNTTGEIDLDRFRKAIFSDYSPGTILEVKQTGVVCTYGTIMGAKTVANGRKDGFMEYRYTIETVDIHRF